MTYQGVVTGGDSNSEDMQDVERICKRHEKMKSERSNWESTWQECMTYILPRKNDVTSKRVQGDKRGSELFDSTAIHSNNLLASELHGMLTHPTVRFFDLTFGDPSIDDIEEVKLWLQDTAERMWRVFENSNYQTEIHEIYLDLGAIGTACLYIGDEGDTESMGLPDNEAGVYFSARPMKEIYIRENHRGVVDILHREYEWKLRSIVQEFGLASLPEDLQRKYKDGCEDDFTIIHDTEANLDPETRRARPFHSIYIMPDKKHRLHKGSYQEFPFAVPRWTKTSGESYGRSAGMDMLPDTKMVNSMKEATIEGAQLAVRPPMMVIDDAVLGRVRMVPGGLTVVRQLNQDVIRPMINDSRVDFGFQMIDAVQGDIRSGFFADQLRLPTNGPQMTATETGTRVEQSLRLMGPVAGRQSYENLRPTINRVYGIMSRKGLLQPMPAVVAKRKLGAKYSSLIARAQRMSEGQNITRAISVAAPLLQIDPSVADKLDGDKAFDYIMDIYGVPQKLQRSRREIEDRRAARAKAEAQLAKEAQEQHQAEVAGKVLPAAAQLEQARQVR